MKHFALVITAILAATTLLAASSNNAAPQKEGKVTPLKGFPEASLTIFPVTYTITGPVEEHRELVDAFKRETREGGELEMNEALGLLLEEKGYDKFERTDTAFRFPEGKAARKERAAAFGKFVGELDLMTDYALCVEFTYHIEQGFQGVYSVIADAKGGIVWEDSQGPDDPGFDAGSEST